MLLGKNKQLAVNMIASVISYGVSIIIGFFLSPYIVKNIGADAYGFIGLAENFISYAMIVAVALNSMASRFITISIHKDEKQVVNSYYSSVIISNIIMSIVFGVAAIIILWHLNDIINIPKNLTFDVKFLWGLLFFNFFITLITNVYGISTFAYNRLELSAIRNAESAFLKVIILVLIFSIFKPHVWYIGFTSVLCSIYTILFNVYYTKKFMPYIKVSRDYFDIKKVKSLIASGIWNSISKISSLFSTGLDLLITNLFVGASSMGVVSIAKIIPSYVLSLFGILSNAFAPQLTISYAKNDFDDIKKQLISAVRLLGFFAAVPVTCLWVYAGDFFALWMPSQNSSVLHMLTILSTLAFPLSLSLEPLWNVFTVANKVKKSSLFLISNSFVSILITYILLIKVNTDAEKMYVICGVSSVISVIRALTFLPVYGARCLNFKWYIFYGIIGKNVVTFIFSIIFATVFKTLFKVDSWISLIFAVAVTGMAICVINCFIMLKKSERSKLLKILNRRK